MRCARIGCFVFCKLFARWVYKKVKGVRRDVLKGVRRAVLKGVLKGVRRAVLKGVRIWCFVFCKLFATWVYKNTRMRWQRDALRSDWMLCTFVKILQHGLTKTHAWDDSAMRCVALSRLMICIFVKYLQDRFTKHTHAMTAMRCVRIWCFVFL